MSNDPGSEGDDPDEVSDWLADLADERGTSKQELLAEFLAGDGVDVPIASSSDVGDLEGRVADLEASVSDLEKVLDDQIQDVRERVIQVKREADAKAPLEHDHPELEESLERLGGDFDGLAGDVRDLGADLGRVEERIDELDDRMARGFSNYEDVLSYLVDATDDLNRKVDTLARTLLEVRELATRLETADARRAGVDRLCEPAQRHGVTEAKCEDCGETVHLGVLTAPRCPHCEATFAQLDPSRGFFRASVLRTGRRPALDGEVDREPTDLDAIVSDEVDAPPDLDLDAASPARQGADPDAATAREGAASASEGVVDGDGGVDADGMDPDGVDAEDVGDSMDGAADHAVEELVSSDHPEGPSGDAAGRNVDTVPGIGPAYAERLHAAGVDTVGALAGSDPERLAERTDVARGRVETWISRAEGRLEDR